MRGVGSAVADRRDSDHSLQSNAHSLFLAPLCWLFVAAPVSDIDSFHLAPTPDCNKNSNVPQTKMPFTR